MTEQNVLDPVASEANIPRFTFTKTQAAVAIGVSNRKLDQLIADRTSGIPIVRIGRKVLFPIAELGTWLSGLIGKQVS